MRIRPFCPSRLVLCACVCLGASAPLLGCLDRGVALLDQADDEADDAAASDGGGGIGASTTVDAGSISGDTCGNTTAAVVAAAQAFLASLDGADAGDGGDAGKSPLLALANLPFTAGNAERWTSLPGGARNGPDFAQLSLAQQDRALALARAALGTEGYDELQNIRAADDVMASTVASDGGAAAGLGSELTHVAVLGTPSTSSAWMLQICLHHLVYTLVYGGPQVSGTPVFLGTEPPDWTLLADGRTLVTGLVNGVSTSFVDGVESTTAVSAAAATGGTRYAALQAQRVAVQSLLAVLLADTPRAMAAKLPGTFTDVVYGVSAAGNDGNFPFSSAASDALVYPTGTSGRGVLYSSLSAAEKAATLATIEAWVDTQACDIRAALLAAYESDEALAATYVGYGVPLGAEQPSFVADPNDQAAALDYLGSYLRIDGPRVWIEMVVVESVAYRNQGWVTYHSLWRDKTADYGGEFPGSPAE